MCWRLAGKVIGEREGGIVFEEVDILADEGSPFLGGAGLVESGIRDGATDDELHGFAPLGKHLAREERHFEIEFDAESFAEVGEEVEAFAILGVEIEGDDVALVADGFFDEGGFPIQIFDGTILFAGAEASGEIEEGVVVGESLFEGIDIGGIATDFVDRDEEGGRTWQIEQEIVDGELDVGTVMAHSPHEGETVWATEGMVAGDNGIAAGGDIVGIHHIHLDVEIPGFRAFEEGMDEIEAEFVTVAIDAAVQIVDMQDAIHQTDSKFWELDVFCGKDFLDVDVVFGNFGRLEGGMFHRRDIIDFQIYRVLGG